MSGPMMSPDRRAWPYIAAVQCVVVVGLAAAWWVGAGPTGLTISDIDPVEDAAHLDRALAAAQSSQALWPDDQIALSSFLSLSADAAGLRAESVDIEDAPAVDGVIDVRVRVNMLGDPFELPLFMALSARQRAVGRVDSVDVRALGTGVARISVEFTYARPARLETDWVQTRATEAGASGDAAALLARAAELASARRFFMADGARLAAAKRARERVGRELPVHLTALRTHGGRVRWSPTEGSVRSRGSAE